MAEAIEPKLKPSALRLSELLSVALSTFPIDETEFQKTAQFSPTASSIFKTQDHTFPDYDFEVQAPPPLDSKVPHVYDTSSSFGTGTTDALRSYVQTPDAAKEVKGSLKTVDVAKKQTLDSSKTPKGSKKKVDFIDKQTFKAEKEVKGVLKSIDTSQKRTEATGKKAEDDLKTIDDIGKKRTEEAVKACMIIATDKKAVTARYSKQMPESNGSSSCRCQIF